MKKLSARLWCVLIIVGFAGQLAWTVENMYLNVFLYNTIATDPRYIAAMVAASAICATLTTLLMGVISDRVGKRKAFICVGYLVWGVVTAAFGFLTVSGMEKLFPAVNAVALTAIAVVVLDCVMTFFGSTANDAAYNAYVTDVVPNDKRGRVEGVLAVLSPLSLLVVFGLMDGMTQRGEWRKFFLIVGGVVTLAGLVACFLMPEATVRPAKRSFLSEISYGFRPSTVRAHKRLYLSLVAMCVFCIATQIFFPYLIIYMQHYLKLDSYAIVLGVALIVGAVASVACGRLIDRVGKMRFVLPATALTIASLVGMFFARGMAWVMVSGTALMSGYMLLTAAFQAQIRELTPPDKAGHFQGVRMIFMVMLPMIIGPSIGSAVIRGGGSYTELGVVKSVPTPEIFLAAMAVLVVAIAPVLLLMREERKPC